MRHLVAIFALVTLLTFASQASYACEVGAFASADASSVGVRNRAVAAFVDQTSGSVYLSWRLLTSDSAHTAFDVYRCKDGVKPVKVHTVPHSKGTNVLDSVGCHSFESCQAYSWVIAAVNSGAILNVTVPTKVSNQTGQGFTAIATGIGAFGRRLGYGDLDGDGQLDFTLRYSGVTVDPYYKLWRPSPGTYKVVAFNRNKPFLWLYDMGPSIERGLWYSPYLIYDLDQDGVAELIVKGGDDELERGDLVDESGRVVKGPEYVKIISGKDGATLLGKAPWPDRSGFVGGSGPYSEYNRYSRNQMAIAYVDGEHPHLVVERGTYGKQKVHVYRYGAKTGLELVWQWQNTHPAPSKSRGDLEQYRALDQWWGQGAHTIGVGDVDGDGKDEVILGSTALDDDGSPLWTFNRGDLDHIYLGDLNPRSPGLEVYYGAERGHAGNGMGMVRGSTGELLWGIPEQPTRHIHKEGLCADLYSGHPGTECYSGEADRSSYWTWSSDGNVLSQEDLGGLRPKAAYWGPDAQKGLLRIRPDVNALPYADIVDIESGKVIDQIQRPTTMLEKDRRYLRVLAIADVIGDWREEILAVDRGHLLMYMSTVSSPYRQPWLMQDHTYKMKAILGSMGYYHQPLLGYDLQTALQGHAKTSRAGPGANNVAPGRQNSNPRKGNKHKHGPSSGQKAASGA